MLKKTVLGLILTAVVLVATAAAQVRVEPLNFKERVLKNGMKIITLEDRSSPTVTVQVWYRVGAKDDPAGRSGFAHLFEHMMFKSTKNMKNEMLDRLTEDVGGWNNASTWYDYTNYYEVIPSNYLETLLWAEADRMVNLNVDTTNFASERDVVKEEYREGILAPPYGRFFDWLERRSFPSDPDRRTVIGSLEHLSVASLEDAQQFYSAFYRPDNAFLIVVGDFDSVALDGWIDKYFGKIESPGGKIPYLTNDEPDRTSEKRFNESAPNVPLPAIALSYLIPPANHEDRPALQVAEAILSGGQSSRLYQELVYKQQVASESGVYSSANTNKSVFALFAIAAGGKQIETVEKSLMAEIKKMQTAPVAASELEKAKNQLVTNELSSRETVDGKAGALGRAEILLGGAAEANKQIDKLRAVTAADIQRVMRKYFTDTNRVVISYKDETTTGGQK